VSRDLFPTAPPPVVACGEVRMTREERMRALCCLGRAMVMNELAHGAGMPGTLNYADAQKAMAAMMKRDATPPFHPCHALPFSVRAQQGPHLVLLSPDRLTATQTSLSAIRASPSEDSEEDSPALMVRVRGGGHILEYFWARSEHGVDGGCGVVRWALQLGQHLNAFS